MQVVQSKKEYVLVEDDADQELNEELTDDEDEEESVEFVCASRGYHVYQKVWLPKKKDKLIVAFEKNNVYDPYACGLYLLAKGTIFGKCLVGHIPRELSRFTKFFLDYGGLLTANVKATKFRQSPLPQGGLEIPIKLAIGKGEASDDVFEKMKDFVDNNYIEPEKVSVIQSKKDDNVDLL